MQRVLKNKIIQLVLAGLILGLSVQSSPVTIYGTAIQFAGDSLVFYIQSNPIIQIKTPVGTCFFDEMGRFEMEINLDQIQPVYAEDGKNKYILFAEPGAAYEVVFPPRSQTSLEDVLNPYFQPQQIHLGIKNTYKNELNALVQEFDMVFNPYFNMYARQVYANKKLEDVDAFKLRIDSLFGSVDHAYFNNYQKFRLVLLDYMRFSGESKTYAYQRFPYEFMTLNNPAAVELFGQVFSRIMYHIMASDSCHLQQDPFTDINGLATLQSCVHKSTLIRDSKFIDLAILKGIYDEFSFTHFDRNKLIQIMQMLIDQTKFQDIKAFAMDLHTEITRLDPGQPAPYFQLMNGNGKSRILDDYKGRYLYLGFVSTQSYACMMQFPILAELKKSFQKELDIVTIAVEESYQDLADVLEYKAYPWEFLYFDDQFELLLQYKVRAYPTYYLIDPHGRLLWSPSVSPIDGFETKFLELIDRER